MFALVRLARRRLLHNELLSQGATAFSAALIALILLLLAGTEVIDWTWLLAIPAAAIAFGVYRAIRRIPSPYCVAQMVDRRLNLADTLSTALFFHNETSSKHAAPEIRRCQLERAEQTAGTVDIRQAVPYVLPRGAYLVAALVLVASSLFALRYGLSRKLDLKPPLASMLQQQLGWTPRTDIAKETRRNPKAADDPQPDDSASADQDQKGEGRQDAQQNDSQDGEQQAAEKGNAQKDQGKKSGDEGDKKGGGDQQDQAESKSDNSSGENPGKGQQGSNKQDQAQSGGKQDANSSGESSSLMSKMKDAVQNLLSKIKPQQGNQGSQQQQGSNQPSKQQGQGQQKGKQQQSAKNGQQNGEQPGDAQEGQNGEEAKNQQDPQGKGTGKSDSEQASKQPGSGIGSQDGDKSIKQAEQLAAMGKITELLGKRSANISGEATVEVKSTSQQLHTQYVQSGAQHTQAGAEISRDEVPVALQGYVEQYFEQVRKQAAVKKQ